MYIQRFAYALMDLPPEWLELEACDMRTCEYKNMLILAHKDKQPITYQDHKWKTVSFNEVTL